MDNIEYNYLTEDQEKITGIIGVKGSGKTHLILKTLEFYMNSNIHHYDAYHLILPSFLNDNDSSQYDFLRNRKDVIIYTKYSPLVLEKIVQEKLKNKNSRIVLVVDDSTQFGKDMTNDETFKYIVTCSRHIKIRTIIATHTLKKIIDPAIRSNLDSLFIMGISNRKLLEDIYDEFFSLFREWGNFKQFLETYQEKVFLNKEHNFIFLNTILKEYSTDGNKMKFVNYEYNYENQGKKNNIKLIEVDTQKDEMKQKIEVKNKKQLMIQKYNEAKNKKI